jgi:Phage integrase family
VFTNEFGGAVDPRNLLRVRETAAKTANVEGVGVHTLRHSAAVGWLESRVHIKAVADLLGHSSIRVTGDFTNPHHRSPTSRRSRSAPYVTLVDGRCFYPPGVDAAAEVGSIAPVSASAACRADARRATAASVKTDSPRSP